MTANILHCPDEILVAVVKYLERKAIKAVRESCKKLNQISSPYLYPVVYISCHQLDLDVFNLVASNPLLIGNVCELVIGDTTFPTCITDWATYKNAIIIRDILDNQQRDDDAPQDVREDGMDEQLSSVIINRKDWEIFSSFLRGHHENRLGRTDIKALNLALPHLKSLRSLVITNRRPCEHWDDGAQSLVSMSPFAKKIACHTESISNGLSTLFPRCDWKPDPYESNPLLNTFDWLGDSNWMRALPGDVSKYFSDLSFSHIPEQQNKYQGVRHNSVEEVYTFRVTRKYVFRYRMHDHTPETVIREARAILVALEVLENSQIRSQLQESRVDASVEQTIDPIYDIDKRICDPGLTLTLFSHFSPIPNRLLRAFSAAENTKKFRLVLRDDEYFRSPKLECESVVTQLLASMPNLEELHFEPHGMDTVGVLPQDMIYPRLRSVTFSCGRIDPRSVISFLRRQKHTLKKLTIQYCNIDPDLDQDCGDVVDQMEDLQRTVPNLEDVKIDRVFVGYRVDACGLDTEMYKEAHTYEDIFIWTLQNGSFIGPVKHRRYDYL